MNEWLPNTHYSGSRIQCKINDLYMSWTQCWFYRLSFVEMGSPARICMVCQKWNKEIGNALKTFTSSWSKSNFHFEIIQWEKLNSRFEVWDKERNTGSLWQKLHQTADPNRHRYEWQISWYSAAFKLYIHNDRFYEALLRWFYYYFCGPNREEKQMFI